MASIPSLPPLLPSLPQVQRFVHPPPVPPESYLQLFGKSFVSYVHATHVILGRSKETIGAEISAFLPSSLPSPASSPVHISLGNDHAISREHIHLTWNPIASAPATAAESLERAIAAASSPATAASSSSSSSSPTGAWELTVAGKNGYWFNGVKFAMSGPLVDDSPPPSGRPCPPHVLCQREASLLRIGAAKDDATMFWILPAQATTAGAGYALATAAGVAAAESSDAKAKGKKRKIGVESRPSLTSAVSPPGDAASLKKKKKRSSTAAAADATALPSVPTAFSVGSDDLPLTAFLPQGLNPIPRI